METIKIFLYRKSILQKTIITCSHHDLPVEALSVLPSIPSSLSSPGGGGGLNGLPMTISGGLLSHVAKLTTNATAATYVATRICSVKALAKTCATSTCCVGEKVSMTMGDLYKEVICAGDRAVMREEEERLRELKRMVAMARPMLPPRERSWARAPCVTAVCQGG
jgi:hypothetical protein